MKSMDAFKGKNRCFLGKAPVLFSFVNVFFNCQKRTLNVLTTYIYTLSLRWFACLAKSLC